MPAAEYRIRVTPAGDAVVVVDSGAVALPDGADLSIIAVDNTGPGAAPAFSGVEFRGSTGFVSLLPGEYHVFVTLAGDTTPAIAVEGVALDGGEVYSAIASDPVGEEVAPGLIVIDHVALKAPSL